MRYDHFDMKSIDSGKKMRRNEKNRQFLVKKNENSRWDGIDGPKILKFFKNLWKAKKSLIKSLERFEESDKSEKSEKNRNNF